MSRFKRIMACFVLLPLLAAAGIAVVPVGARAQEELELTNLIIDRTKTRYGKDFHQAFVAMWEPVQDGVEYNIMINEIADARWGSLVFVFVNDRPVYRTSLGVRSGAVEDTVKQAIQTVQVYLMRLSIGQQSSADSEDLAGDGL